jgi:hypothetical protein
VSSEFKEEPGKHVHVVNPGHFANDRSFVVLYPTQPEGIVIEPSKLEL